ncbi:GYF domain-containing protein [Rubripirellula reticaptiva]|uniref:GYF domain-containing protein n=1 Tax=Rubripirellula reticaptiva TaxID=2528013 RepID=A0A5C6FBF0_9BACT|nr:GYF domain-containing protein [Rubripirellula reticaptiva]TWU58122.1 hypothetical protein Poly59_10310 [Rubripirellula reticaptiva]
MTDWFVQQKGTAAELGPLKPSDLLEKVRTGEVTRQTMVRKNDSPWFLASEVGGLFEAAMRPTIENFCPKCRGPISDPPTVCNRCGMEIQQAITRITENTIINRADQSLGSQASQSVKQWLMKKRINKDEKKAGEN